MPTSKTPHPSDSPLKQARALRTRENLLAAGRRLLRDGGFDDVSIAQIAKLAGCSVGAFYFSFRDKEAYFRFLLDSVFADIQVRSKEQLVPHRPAEPDIEGMVRRCVDHFVEIAREHEGLIRTVNQHTAHDLEGWQPTRTLGLWLVALYRDCVVPHVPAAERSRVARNATVAFQIVMGYIVNAVMHKPEPLGLHSPALGEWMAAMVLATLQRRDLPNPEKD